MIKRSLKGQHLIEYILIFAVVIVVLLFALTSGGFLTRRIDSTLDIATGMIEFMPNCICYGDDVCPPECGTFAPVSLDPNCAPDGVTCSAPVGACEQQTVGLDNCGQVCTRVGPPCTPAPAPPCTPTVCNALPPACGEITFGFNDCHQSCTLAGPPCATGGPPGPGCVPAPGSCSAVDPLCGTGATNYGTDNCGLPCSITAGPCGPFPPGCSGGCSAALAACGTVTYGYDNCGNLCTSPPTGIPAPCICSGMSVDVGPACSAPVIIGAAAAVPEVKNEFCPAGCPTFGSGITAICAVGGIGNTWQIDVDCCGDGDCDGPGETCSTCPQDCTTGCALACGAPYTTAVCGNVFGLFAYQGDTINVPCPAGCTGTDFQLTCADGAWLLGAAGEACSFPGTTCPAQTVSLSPACGSGGTLDLPAGVPAASFGQVFDCLNASPACSGSFRADCTAGGTWGNFSDGCTDLSSGVCSVSPATDGYELRGPDSTSCSTGLDPNDLTACVQALDCLADGNPGEPTDPNCCNNLDPASATIYVGCNDAWCGGSCGDGVCALNSGVPEDCSTCPGDCGCCGFGAPTGNNCPSAPFDIECFDVHDSYFNCVTCPGGSQPGPIVFSTVYPPNNHPINICTDINPQEVNLGACSCPAGYTQSGPVTSIDTTKSVQADCGVPDTGDLYIKRTYTCTNICGDNNIVPPEQCDNTNLNGQTCITRGHDGQFGAGLQCNPGTCTFNESSCTDCNNGALEPGEACDGTNFGGLTCADFPPATSGLLNCINNCTTIDSGGCT